MLRQSTMDMMNELLLPFMKPETAEFNTFNYAINSYILGNKDRMIQHLNCLTSSSNREIAGNSKAVIERARLENF